VTRRRARRHLSTRDASRGRARARRDAMVLGVSTTTLVLAIGAGALALGPRDVPVAAKFLGRLTGRAVAHVGGVARAIERATNERELRGIRAEVRASMKDLRGVAREIERELTPSGRRGEDEGEGEREGGTSATATTATSRDDSRTSTSARYERVIPVSARAVGATPASGGFGVAGSEVLAASFKEREVALKAARLMESGAIDDYLAKREREGGTE
jgi:Sec-independent protein translocase protein TatA|tara:strand:- start:938 stop:1585 length:648 start_codon:yes stop_codon:yes gene_type:complete